MSHFSFWSRSLRNSRACFVRSSQVSIYHCTTSVHNPFRWNMLNNGMNAMLRKYPLKSAAWYPSLKILTTLSIFRFSTIFVHFIPGFFLDLLARLTGGRPRYTTFNCFLIKTVTCMFFKSTNNDTTFRER